MSQEPTIRHYRGASRGDVEQAYRAEAAQAAGAGYLPVTHQWTTDRQGYLLAVTYRQSTALPRMPAPAAPMPLEQAQPATAVAPPAVAPPAAMTREPEHFAPSQPPSSRDPYSPFAPREADEAPVAHDQFVAVPAVEQLDYMPLGHAQPRYEQPVAEQPVAEQPVQAAAVPALPPTYAQPEPTYPQPAAPQAQPEPTYPQPEPTPPQPQPANVQPRPEPTFEQPTPEQPVEQQAQPALEQAQPPTHAQPELVQAEPAQPQVAEPAAMQAEAAAQPVAAQAEPAQPPVAREPDPTPAPIGRGVKLTVQTLDLHCAGEPLRIIRSGFPDVPSMPALERRKWVLENADQIRRAVIQEPRGHRDMYGAILLPPFSDDADLCVLFMHNDGYSTMCGHGIIAITTALIEEGLYPATEPVTTIRYEVPAGIVTANASTVRLENGEWAVQGVRFINVPSYVAAQSLSVRPDGVALHGAAAQYGALSVDLSFGGAYYGIVNAAELGLRVVPEQADALRRAGAAITDVLRRDHTPSHPTDPDLSFVYGTIIVDLDPALSPDGRGTRAHMRNATIFANAELDRSPCGSGTSAILAQLHARGRIKVGQEIINAGITGEHFLGRVEAETALGPYPAVSTSIAGSASVTGYSTFVVDERDPLGEGFLLS